MTREQLMKMSKKELKARLAEVSKEAQDKSGEELNTLVDEAKTIGEIMDEIKAREDLAKAAQAAAGRKRRRECRGQRPGKSKERQGIKGRSKDHIQRKEDC